MNSHYHCLACDDNDVELILDLGLQPLANRLLTQETLTEHEPRFPLRLGICTACWMIQILDIIPPHELFSKYLYYSSFSDLLLRHAQSAAAQYITQFRLDSTSFVVEIASNDGYMLRNFVEAGIPCLGIEPATDIARVAREKGVDTLNDFFNSRTARDLVDARGHADMILANNVFAHVPDINDFLTGLNHLITPEGIIVLEFPYAVDLLTATEFDTIYHEHVFYFTLAALMPLFDRHKLRLFRIEKLTIHGGSLRTYLCKSKSHSIESSVEQLVDDEHNLGVRSLQFYRGFSDRVASIRQELVRLLRELKRQGSSLAAYGAAAKGSTLLNYCNIATDVLDFVADRSPYKQGLFMPGTHLPIVPPSRLVEDLPDYTLLLTWNFAGEILKQQQAYRNRGGRFIIPIPKVSIV